MQGSRKAPMQQERKGSRGVTAQAILEVLEWLVGNDCHELDDAALIAGLGLRLCRIGLPIDRLALHLRTLHPEILGRTVAWAPNEPVEIRDREHGFLAAGPLAGSPLRQVMDTGEAVLVKVAEDNPPAWSEIDIFQGRHLIEHYIVPLCNADGPVSAASFCTTAQGGFSVADLAALDRLLPALRNICELRVLRRTELTLLDTYVGTATARRILAGHIRRGAVETLEAALLLCDLRGFTELSNRLSGHRILQLLDIYFDRVVPAITEAGGEILKFMGDAVLAFFPKDDAAQSCQAALSGAVAALARLRTASQPDAALHAGIALHYGEVSYGNIGSGQRLDFTLIGPDVNLVCRIQSACSSTNEALLMSSRMAALLPSPASVPIGRHVLRGFAEPVELYAATTEPVAVGSVD